MALDKPYLDVPGTTVFDADQSRKGYHLNQFCMSLMKAANRERFKANERAYLDEWPMTEAQKEAVLARDLNRCIALGGNIYFLAKIGATDGKSFHQITAHTQVAVIQKTTQTAYPLWDVVLARNTGRLRPYIRLLNLSNTGYEEIPGVPLQGRTIMAGTEFNWSRKH